MKDNLCIDLIMPRMAEAALACGEILLKQQQTELSVQQKTSARDVVTQYDLAVEQTLMRTLGEAFPGAVFFTEESCHQADLAAPLVFVIDPIDGTMNFVKGMDHSCISIACLQYGKPAAGVVYNPYRREMFSAAAGKGAFLNGKPIRVSDAPLSESLVLFGTSPYNLETLDESFRKIRAVYDRCVDIRRLGSAALDICYVACGRAGLYFEARLSLWDYAAAAVILTEAGGRVCTFTGEGVGFGPEKSSVVAGSCDRIRESGLI